MDAYRAALRQVLPNVSLCTRVFALRLRGSRLRTPTWPKDLARHDFTIGDRSRGFRSIWIRCDDGAELPDVIVEAVNSRAGLLAEVAQLKAESARKKDALARLIAAINGDDASELLAAKREAILSRDNEAALRDEYIDVRNAAVDTQRLRQALKAATSQVTALRLEVCHVPYLERHSHLPARVHTCLHYTGELTARQRGGSQ